MKKIIYFLFTMFISLLSTAQTVECFDVVTPEKVLQNTHKIAIMDFGITCNPYFNEASTAGTKLNSYMTELLLKENRGIYKLEGGWFSGSAEGKTYEKTSSINIYKLIERSQLDNVLREQNFASSGMVTDNQAAQVGKLLGIDVIIIGQIDIKPASADSKVSYNDGTVANCKENSVQVAATIKLISVTTGEILGTNTYTCTKKDKQCGKDIDKTMSYGQLLDAGLISLSFSLVDYFAPHYIYCKYEFEKIKVDQFKDKVKNIDDYLKNGDLQSAYAVYKAIYDADNYNASAAYNLAILYDMTGDAENCSNYIEIANQIDAKRYGKFYTATKKTVEMIKTLQSMGITFEKYDFQTSATALAEKITTKGKDADRIDVYTDPDPSTAVVAKIPGGKEFIVLEKKGDWSCIQLLGGKKGWINKSNCK